MADQKLTLKILGDAKSAVDALKKTQSEVSKTGQDSQKAGATGALGGLALAGAFAAAAAVVVKFGKEAVTAAAAAEVKQRKLEVTVRNAGISWTANAASINKTLSAQKALSAYSGGDLKTALTTLIRMTRSAADGQKYLGVATDLSRATGMDLETSAKLLGKVYNGNVSILKRYGIVVQEGATATEALDAIQRSVAGSAAAYGRTLEGQTAILDIQWKTMQTQLGSKLIPTLTDFLAAENAIVKENGFFIASNPWNLIDVVPMMKANAAQRSAGVGMGMLRDAAVNLTGSVGGLAAAEEDLSDATHDATGAWKEQQLTLTDKQSQLRATIDRVIDHKNAEKALSDYLKGGGKKGTAEYTKLLLAKRDAHKLVKAQAQQMTDKEVTAAEKAGVLSHKLADYIRKINNIPKAKTTHVTMTGGGAMSGPLMGKLGFGTLGWKMTGYATGGFASGPTSGYPAMLHGNEAIIPLSTKYRSQAQALMPQVINALGGGSGGNNIIQMIDGSAFDADMIGVMAGVGVRNVLADAAFGG